jgi:hypothetical protein
MGIRSDYIDLAIGLAVVFFLSSLVVSGLNEGLQWFFRVRPKFLWAYLYDLVDPSRGAKDGGRMLPRGFGGVLGLWGRANDRRPSATSDGAPARPTSTEPATGPDGQELEARKIAPGTVIAGVAHALDPLDAPQLTRIGGAKRTTIQNVPPGSLAQAFIEYFADLGKERVVEQLVAIAQARRDGRPVDETVTAVAREMSGHDASLQAQLEAALRPFLSSIGPGGDPDQLAADLTGRVRAVANASPHDTLAAAAKDYAAAVTAAPARQAGSDASADPVEPAARGLASELVRSFPDHLTRQRIDAAVDMLNDAPLGPTARRVWEGAEKKVDEFRIGLEAYFAGDMARLSGYYRRSIRVVLIALAVIVAIACNVNAVGLARDLWRNPEGRAALVAQADTLATASSEPSGAATLPNASAPTTSPAPIGLGAIQAKCEEQNKGDTSAFNDPDDAAKAFNDIRSCVTDALSAQSGLNVIDEAIWLSPHSWARSWYDGRDNWALHLAGVALTAVALLVGAPFWFDLLKRLTGLRRVLRQT